MGSTEQEPLLGISRQREEPGFGDETGLSLSSLALFGANVYLHDFGDQQIFLHQIVAPWATAARSQGWLRYFVYDHFDARGPHLALFCAARGTCRYHLEAELAARADAFLAGQNFVPLAEEELETRHQACRGRQQSRVDGEVGFPAPGTWIPFDIAEGGYPFRFMGDPAAAASFYASWTEVSHFAMTRMGGDPRPDWPAAIALVASLDRGLAAAGREPADFWRYDASRLLPVLLPRPGKDLDSQTLAAADSLISARNRAVFAQYWDSPLAGAEQLPPLTTLLRAATGSPADPELEPDWAPLRTLVHAALKTLGITVVQQIPLVLYAWRRHSTAG